MRSLKINKQGLLKEEIKNLSNGSWANQLILSNFISRFEQYSYEFDNLNPNNTKLGMVAGIKNMYC